MTIRTVNPANEEVLREFYLQSGGDVERALENAASAFQSWRKLSFDKRGEGVSRLAEDLRQGRQEIAKMITHEMGKTLTEALAEVDKCASSCQLLAEKFPSWRAQIEEHLPTGFQVTREPLGPLLGIMPWNYPLWQVIRFAVPAVLCGNSILLKHAPNTWGVAEKIEELFGRAFPQHVYQNLRVEVGAVSKIIADRRVRGVSLTGSRGAGASVAAQAGAHLKKCVLELGGSDAYVILDDADLDLAAEVCAKARMLNAGQSCVAAKRFIVTEKNAFAFTEKFKTKLSEYDFGDPMRTGTRMGPLARRDLRDHLHQQVEASVKCGARLEMGGELPAQKGFFYPATLLTAVRASQPAFDEELFGPVASLIEVKNEKEAFRVANASVYGLGGAVFSRDVERAQALAVSEMDSGMVFVNDFVRSDASVPFGGVKDSGLGRELGRDGSFEFTNVKTVFAKSHA